MEAAEALRAAILFGAWPGMALLCAYVLWQGWRFHNRVEGSPFGRLVLLMVVGWTVNLGVLAFLATLLLQHDPAGIGPLAGAFLAFWAGNMALVVWLMHRWGAEAVHINLYYAELASMDKVKSTLINTVAHELNTPLTPIAIKMAMLREGRFGPLTQPQAEALQSMERNVRRLSLLVDQIVLSTQIQTKRLSLLGLPTPVAEWIGSIVAPFRDRAAAEQRPFTVVLEVPADLTVDMDGARMGRVLSSLLDNAFRFTPTPGAVGLAARTLGDRFLVEVWDAGIGFTSEQAELLFQPMRAAHDPTQTTEVGAGLSLYVAKGLVEAHGGKAWARSPGLHQGATFGFELPLGPRPSAPAPSRPPG